MQARGRTLLLSNFPRVESQVPETHFRTSRHFLSSQVPWRTGWVVFSKGLQSCLPVSQDHCKGSSKHHLLPTEPTARYFPWQRLKKILSIMLSSVSLLPKFVSYSLEASNFFRLESKPSVPYVNALGQTQCLHPKCKISCGWFSSRCKNS